MKALLTDLVWEITCTAWTIFVIYMFATDHYIAGAVSVGFVLLHLVFYKKNKDSVDEA